MKDATQIVIVLDRSGSMEVVREATIESFNQFMVRQKALPSDAGVFFVQFNTEYQVLRQADRRSTHTQLPHLSA